MLSQRRPVFPYSSGACACCTSVSCACSMRAQHLVPEGMSTAESEACTWEELDGMSGEKWLRGGACHICTLMGRQISGASWPCSCGTLAVEGLVAMQEMLSSCYLNLMRCDAAVTSCPRRLLHISVLQP